MLRVSTGLKVSVMLLSLMQIPASQGEVLLEERYEHYTIAPIEVDQIKFELRKNSPISRANQIFHGGTEWTLVPHFRWKRERYQCRIKDVMVKLNGTYTLPKLYSTVSATTSTKKRFNAYYEALLGHEKGHQNLWLKAGEEIERTLNNFEPYFSCDELAKQAKIRIAGIIKNYQQLNRDYDKQTGHGRTQGAAIR